MGQSICSGAENHSQSVRNENEHFQSVFIVDEEGQENTEKIGSKDFKIMKVIGRGSFGKVMLVKKSDNQRLYAMKSLRKQNIRQKKFIQQTRAEKTILQGLKHPFIIRLHYAFQTKQKLYLVMEFVNGGELFFHLRKFKRFSEEQARFYSAEILLAIEYLHSKNIVYRDLKPENILLDCDGHIKLTDFGLAKQLTGDKTYTFCGTPEYMAPELLKGGGYSETADWWTFGALLYEMVVGKPPFYCKDKSEMFQNIIQKNTFNQQNLLSEQANLLLQGLLNKDPKYRLGACGAQEIKKDAFYNGIDWELLANRQVKPSWRPIVNGPTDLTYIDPIFTKEPVQDTPLTKKTLPNQSAFQDFTYQIGDQSNQDISQQHK